MKELLQPIFSQLRLGLIFPSIFLNVWLLWQVLQELQPLVSILIAAIVIAFLLDYPIRFLQDRGLCRQIASAIILLVALLLFVGTIVFVVPIVLKEANEFLLRLPEWVKSGQGQIQLLEDWAIQQKLPIDLSATVDKAIDRLTDLLRSTTNQVISITVSAINSIVNIFLTIVFAVFLVLRGEQLWNGILSWFPLQWREIIRESLPDNFERYIAGQVTIAGILAIGQTVALLILGVPLAELFGIGIGAASLIPLGGTTTIVAISCILALKNFWLGLKVLATAIVITQIVENGIAPRVVGELTGLNPVWMLIALDIGLKLGGVLGLVVAVPMASFIKGTFDRIRTNQFSSLDIDRPIVSPEALLKTP